VIYAVPQHDQSDRAVVQAMEWVKEVFTSKIERGITFSFVRLDVSAEPEFASVFDL
jgi:hypothetical protein